MTNAGEKHLPNPKEIAELTGYLGEAPIFQGPLCEPLATILHRPGKRFRHKLVELGALYEMRRNQRPSLSPTEVSSVAKMGRLIEQMHAASLIIDDIQDNSQSRRGLPTLHKTHGLPIALNAGNWLYFWQLHQLRELGLDPEQELEITRYCLDTYLNGHFGQSLDLGYSASRVKQEDVWPLALANMRMKTGALMAFALCSGAIVTGASRESLSALANYGQDLGIYLQMQDDLGNLLNSNLGEKQGEDLRNDRIGFLRGVAALQMEAEEYEEFSRIAQSESPGSIALFLNAKGALTRAETLLKARRRELWNKKHTPQEIREELYELESALEKAYG